MKNFKVGDVVELKSGSPKMTVRNYSSKRGRKLLVTCQWYDYDKYEFQTENFLEGQLTKIVKKEVLGQ